ncbi:MAG: hypothetical protein COA65_09540 [Rhodospirillaceae bacterium]|nr:MAG: hypothetical protein COA65_09540 [Rhodospirillaceae bacterium]
MAKGHPFSERAGVTGVTYVAVHVTPKASRTRIEGLRTDAKGETALKIAVTAAPDQGKANAAMCRLLAREWGLAKRQITIVQGAKARRKLLRLSDNRNALAQRLEAWLKTHHG